MARTLRLEFAGALYHVTAPGNARQKIFLDDECHRFRLRSTGGLCGPLKELADHYKVKRLIHDGSKLHAVIVKAVSTHSVAQQIAAAVA